MRHGRRWLTLKHGENGFEISLGGLLGLHRDLQQVHHMQFLSIIIWSLYKGA